MRWTIWKTEHGSGVAGPLISPFDKAIQVVPASFTDEDVERVAEALWESMPGEGKPWAETADYTKYEIRVWSRAALSAYLEPTTKGNT